MPRIESLFPNCSNLNLFFSKSSSLNSSQQSQIVLIALSSLALLGAAICVVFYKKRCRKLTLVSITAQKPRQETDTSISTLSVSAFMKKIAPGIAFDLNQLNMLKKMQETNDFFEKQASWMQLKLQKNRESYKYSLLLHYLSPLNLFSPNKNLFEIKKKLLKNKKALNDLKRHLSEGELLLIKKREALINELKRKLDEINTAALEEKLTPSQFESISLLANSMYAVLKIAKENHLIDHHFQPFVDAFFLSNACKFFPKLICEGKDFQSQQRQAMIRLNSRLLH